MKCFIYVRVSTDKQADKDLSLPAQLAACRQFAVGRGWQVLEEFIEPGASARTANRTELRRLLRSCRGRRNVTAVLVHKIDRLARNLTDYAAIRVLLKRHGIRIVSVQEHFEDSISGQLVENIMAAIAEFYSANLSEEVKKGMRQKVLQGGWPHAAPRGYVWVSELDGRRTLQEHPVDGPLIRSAFEQYARGNQSLKVMAKGLAAAGLRSSRGTPLSRSHLRHILSKSFYAGRIVWKELQIPGRHPALVSERLFHRVQTVLGRRYRPAPTPVVSGFPLRGLTRCATCGGNMMAERHGRFAYYRCCRQQYRRSSCDARFCPVDRIHADVERIWSKVGHGESLDFANRRVSQALSSRFESIAIAREGVVRFVMKTKARSAVQAA